MSEQPNCALAIASKLRANRNEETRTERRRHGGDQPICILRSVLQRGVTACDHSSVLWVRLSKKKKKRELVALCRKRGRLKKKPRGDRKGEKPSKKVI